ncbi:MoaD/ThiS family protein [Ferruginibacter lapsinanis]|uniref:MoaD/ThiS family protein n=1 Tax=Ferruginibacter lapsinanis TaxID=563172 RepID=UPI001E3258BA|nr:MoaD/ThiS family protein [Ferruginibacter lapsinanis]UEG50101.1 MoaD/ThiS family protein [Ferruginibacter lapsinanis]
MKVTVYAVLKDYFDKEFAITEPVGSIAELNEILLQRNAEAKNILPICRFAVNDTFVDNNFELQPNDNIDIIPPSSGG